MIHLHDKIRTVLEQTPGLTQKGLAECLGLNPAAVNRMLYGRRNIRATEIPLIEQYLGVALPLSVASVPLSPFDPDNISAAQQRRLTEGRGALRPAALHSDSLALVPVYAPPLSDKKVADWAPRHPMQFGLAEAFAFYVSGEDMAPRYFAGELIYLHPNRPVENGRDCLIELEDDTVLVRRLVAAAENKIRVATFSPAAQKDLLRAKIRQIYAVIGRG